MPFFNNNGATVGTIENYSSGKGTPTSFDAYKTNEQPNYSLYDSKDGIIDTTQIQLKNADNTNLYLNTGPADYSNYYSKVDAGKLYFSNVVTTYAIVFPAFIESYNESFSPKFNSEQMFGRSDPTQKFSNTTRALSLTFKVLAYDEEHARKNLHAVSALTQFLYPVYDGSTIGSTCNPLVIREIPLIRVRFSNIIQRSGRGSSDINYAFYKDGLLTVPTNLSFTPNVETGFFFSSNAQFLYPKEITVSMTFNVLHEETLGWAKTNKYDWIGKLDSSGNQVKKNVDFPWGNDSISSDSISGLSAGSISLPSSTPTGGEE
jgi:hypothetical protein